MGYSESTFSKYAYGMGGGGHKKEYAVYARENDDNSGRPLTWIDPVDIRYNNGFIDYITFAKRCNRQYNINAHSYSMAIRTVHLVTLDTINSPT